jgi:YidC/Oxa1 family membrane protein insertase
MELWTMWTHALEAGIGLIAAQLGLSEAVAIIVLTLMARAAMMPVSLASAYRMQLNKEAIARLKPALDALREQLKADRPELVRQTMALYRENGISVVDKLSLLNMGSQSLFGLGIFQALNRMSFHSVFLWITNLAKPDLWLTLLVGALTLLGMALMPGALHETHMLLVLAVAVIVSVVAIAALPSALGLYWATSNAVTVVQTLALRGLLAARKQVVAS